MLNFRLAGHPGFDNAPVLSSARRVHWASGFLSLTGEKRSLLNATIPHDDGEGEAAWFSAGSLNDNVMLARAAGWMVRNDGRWVCAACAGRRLRKAA
jgi:hypothetical protein